MVCVGRSPPTRQSTGRCPSETGVSVALRRDGWCEMSAKPYDGTIALRINRPLSDLITLAVRSACSGDDIGPGNAARLSPWPPLASRVGARRARPRGGPDPARDVLDRVDGHVARTTKRPSAFGWDLDPVLDRVADGLIMIGAGMYLARDDEIAALPRQCNHHRCVVSGAALLSHVLVSYTKFESNDRAGTLLSGRISRDRPRERPPNAHRFGGRPARVLRANDGPRLAGGRRAAFGMDRGDPARLVVVVSGRGCAVAGVRAVASISTARSPTRWVTSPGSRRIAGGAAVGSRETKRPRGTSPRPAMICSELTEIIPGRRDAVHRSAVRSGEADLDGASARSFPKSCRRSGGSRRPASRCSSAAARVTRSCATSAGEQGLCATWRPSMAGATATTSPTNLYARQLGGLRP